MGEANRPLAAGLLVVSGSYQFTPLEHACLARCRTPLAFLMTEWRPAPQEPC
jgi:predicted metal-binding membrane protein